MANTIELNAELRNEFGKGAARRVRRENKIPAVVYGHGMDPLHVALPGHETMLALRQANVLLTLKLTDGTEQLALPKQVQRNPIRPIIEHVDLLAVKRGERVSVSIPVTVVGELAQEDDPDLVGVVTEKNELAITAEATSIPEGIEISVEGMKIGDQILAGDVKLPEGVELDEDAEGIVVVISLPAPDVPDEPAEGEEADGEVDETEGVTTSEGADEGGESEE